MRPIVGAQSQSKKSNPHGQSLVSVLVSVAIMGVAFATMMSFSKIMGKQQQQSNTVFEIHLAAEQFVATLNNAAAWTNTYNDAANVGLLGCATGTCLAPAGGNLRVSNSSGGVFLGYDPLASPANGFTSGGTPCTNFVTPPAPNAPPNGSNACPFRLNLTWQPLCPPVGACVTPQIRVMGTWLYNPQNNTVAFNSANYNFALFPGFISGASHSESGWVSQATTLFTCNSGLFSGPWCCVTSPSGNDWTFHINFAQPFTANPNVIVSMQNTYFTSMPGNASVGIHAVARYLSTTGFDGICSVYTVPGNAGAVGACSPTTNLANGAGICTWIAVGN